jgi:hypothetical protein
LPSTPHALEANEHGAEPTEESNDAFCFVGFEDAENEQTLDACSGLAGLGAGAAQAHRSLAAGAGHALGELQEGALRGAPDLIAHRRVPPRQAPGERLSALQGLERNAVRVEPMVLKRPEFLAHGNLLGLASIAGLTPPIAQAP